MPKEDCKYWDKCYQKNDAHLQKYNHPEKGVAKAAAAEESSTGNRKEEEEAVAGIEQSPKRAPKHKDSPGKRENTSPSLTKKTTDGSDGTRVDTSQNKGDEIDTNDLRSEVLGNIAGKDYMLLLQKRIKLSVQKEYDELLRTNEFIRHKFLVVMPPDFYAFWKFLCTLKKDADGNQILEYVSKTFQLELVGAFEFLAGRFHQASIREPGDYLRHWRFFYDPPEFQTLFVRRSTGIHYGYWRDTPQDRDGLLIARNDVAKGCEFEFVAGNMFDAFLHFLDKDFKGSPFTASLVANTKKSMQQFIAANEVRVDQLEPLRKARNAKVVAKTFHRAGIVVPYDAKTQVGYRPLLVSDAELKQMLALFERVGVTPPPNAESNDAAEEAVNSRVKTAVMEKLQPVATAASIALDECDFGTSLELGMDLFCSGRTELHMIVQSLLVPAYTVLSRPQFIAISKAHMEKRSRDLQLSIFDLDE